MVTGEKKRFRRAQAWRLVMLALIALCGVLILFLGPLAISAIAAISFGFLVLMIMLAVVAALFKGGKPDGLLLIGGLLFVIAVPVLSGYWVYQHTDTLVTSYIFRGTLDTARSACTNGTTTRVLPDVRGGDRVLMLNQNTGVVDDQQSLLPLHLRSYSPEAIRFVACIDHGAVPKGRYKDSQRVAAQHKWSVTLVDLAQLVPPRTEIFLGGPPPASIPFDFNSGRFIYGTEPTDALYSWLNLAIQAARQSTE